MYLYFIQIADDGPIKIGISRRPENRLRSLQTACPYRLELVYATGPLTNAPEYEAKFHNWYERYRLQGEWFEPNDELHRHIRQIRVFDEDMEREEAAKRLGLIQ